jgi:hypothetical protein
MALRRIRTPLLVTAIVGVVATAGGVAWAALSNTTSNPGNSMTAGNVTLTDDDGGSTPMFTLAGLKPNDTDTGCIAVTAGGSLSSQVRLYGTTTGTGADPYASLTVTRGTFPGAPPTFDSCTGFTADATTYVSGQAAGVVYAGTLQDFPDTWSAGIVDPPSGAPEDWTANETHVYRFQITLGPNRAAEGKNATQVFTWEAQNT